MSFGNDVIVFEHLVKSGTADSHGNFTMVPQSTSAPGCRHRPLTFREKTELGFDIAMETWKSTLPLKDYDDTLLEIIATVKARDIIKVNDQPYQIIGGVQPFGDMASVPFKMTILSTKKAG